MFKEKVIDLGEIKPYSKHEIVFRNEGYGGDIIRIKPSCGCTSARLDKASGDVSVVYRAESIPVHLRDRGWYDVSKHVTVMHEDGRTDVLVFRARVKSA